MLKEIGIEKRDDLGKSLPMGYIKLISLYEEILEAEKIMSIKLFQSMQGGQDIFEDYKRLKKEKEKKDKIFRSLVKTLVKGAKDE